MIYSNGQVLDQDIHFQEHAIHHVPVQIYLRKAHKDIGFVEELDKHFVQVNNILYNRHKYTFISRAGY